MLNFKKLGNMELDIDGSKPQSSCFMFRILCTLTHSNAIYILETLKFVVSPVPTIPLTHLSYLTVKLGFMMDITPINVQTELFIVVPNLLLSQPFLS